MDFVDTQEQRGGAAANKRMDITNVSWNEYVNTRESSLSDYDAGDYGDGLDYGDPCRYIAMPNLREKFYLITVFGTTVCAFGILSNAMLIYLLTQRLAFKTTHIFYLAFLAFFDICVELSYFLMFSMGIVYDYYVDLTLFHLWHAYVRPVFCLSQTSMTASTYMIVAASLERYLTTAHWTRRNFAPQERIAAVIFVILLSLGIKGTVFFEIEIVKNGNCTGFAEIGLQPSVLALNPVYQHVWMFWCRNVFHVFIPFFLLLFLNGSILWRLRRNLTMRSAVLRLLQNMALGRQQAREGKSNLKAATRMLVAIVTTYLVTNVLNLFITTWEHIDLESLQQKFVLFYTFASDTVSLLTVISGSIRLPIYYSCNKQIRNEVRRILYAVYNIRTFRRKSSRRKLSLIFGTVEDESDRQNNHRNNNNNNNNILIVDVPAADDGKLRNGSSLSSAANLGDNGDNSCVHDHLLIISSSHDDPTYQITKLENNNNNNNNYNKIREDVRERSGSDRGAIRERSGQTDWLQMDKNSVHPLAASPVCHNCDDKNEELLLFDDGSKSQSLECLQQQRQLLITYHDPTHNVIITTPNDSAARGQLMTTAKTKNDSDRFWNGTITNGGIIIASSAGDVHEGHEDPKYRTRKSSSAALVMNSSKLNEGNPPTKRKISDGLLTSSILPFHSFPQVHHHHKQKHKHSNSSTSPSSNNTIIYTNNSNCHHQNSNCIQGEDSNRQRFIYAENNRIMTPYTVLTFSNSHATLV